MSGQQSVLVRLSAARVPPRTSQAAAASLILTLVKSADKAQGSATVRRQSVNDSASSVADRTASASYTAEATKQQQLLVEVDRAARVLQQSLVSRSTVPKLCAAAAAHPAKGGAGRVRCRPARKLCVFCLSCLSASLMPRSFTALPTPLHPAAERRPAAQIPCKGPPRLSAAEGACSRWHPYSWGPFRPGHAGRWTGCRRRTGLVAAAGRQHNSLSRR